MQELYLWLDGIPTIYFLISGAVLIALCYGMERLNKGE